MAKRTAPMLEGKRRKIESPSAAEVVSSTMLASSELLLQTETYEKAKRAAPGLDIYALEQDWREWIAKTGKLPEKPDGAFIGFCKRKAKQHGQT